MGATQSMIVEDTEKEGVVMSTNVTNVEEDSASKQKTINQQYTEATNEDQEKKVKPSTVVRDVIIYIILLVVCIKVIPTYVMQRTIVDGPSMEDTLQDGDQLIVEKISYHFDKLSRFDIIAFYPYGKDIDEYYIKRIIGMPGETIQIIGSDIYINGEVLEENYGKDPISFSGIAAEPITLADDEYFVMGDNRTISLDSRSESVGVVQKEKIGGRAVVRLWPFSGFGLID